VLELDLLERELRDPADPHHARQSLVCIENTVGELGGLVHPQQAVQRVADWAHGHDMALHMDGARLWNAAVASGRPPADLAAPADSLSVCFSKGLGAPVGSAVVGDADFIAVARRNRKLFGGGMRQAGIIAAGALHALRNHVDRLADDHRNARMLAEQLAGGRRLRIDAERVQTKIVLGTVTDARRPRAGLGAGFGRRSVCVAGRPDGALRYPPRCLSRRGGGGDRARRPVLT
jgi:threonine aldolase